MENNRMMEGFVHAFPNNCFCYAKKYFLLRNRSKTHSFIYSIQAVVDVLSILTSETRLFWCEKTPATQPLARNTKIGKRRSNHHAGRAIYVRLD